LEFKDPLIYSFETLVMNRSLKAPIAPGRIFEAWVCIVAVVLLWSPLWAAAWHGAGMSCCADGMCMAHSHSKSQSPRSADGASDASPMDCDHSGPSGIADCSMSCCHEATPSFATAVIFVMPEPALLHVSLANIGVTPKLTATEFLQSFEPLSPPPRTSIFSI
jgi:hypothetical protein